MSALTPEQATEVRAIVAEMMSRALRGANVRVSAVVGELSPEIFSAISSAAGPQHLSRTSQGDARHDR